MFVVVLVAAAVVGFVVTRGRSNRQAAAPAPARPETEPTTSTGVPSAPPPKGLADRIRSLFRGGVTDDTWRELEEALIRADVGPKGSADVVARVRATYRAPADPSEVVTAAVAKVFEGDGSWSLPEGSPTVVMVIGVNGTGKTTTIGKLASYLGHEGRSVGLAASDTFRAAAGEQLETWATRSGAYLVAQERGADPGAVAFDAVKKARARGTDVLIVDTAGRLHTRTPLMEELKKVKRVLEKAAGKPVDEVLLVLDATTGQNGIQQARAFAETAGVTGVVLTKMDGSARGGIVVAVREELGVPVRFVGTGERIGDLAPFDPQAFARRLIS